MTREEKVAELERMLAKVPDVMSPLKASKCSPFRTEKRADQVHREMLKRESSERTLRNILYTKVSKSKKRKCYQDQPNDHHKSENRVTSRME